MQTTTNIDNLIETALKGNVLTVLIEKRHVENTDYKDCTDCGLARAIKEQYPDFKLMSVAGTYIRAANRDCYRFNADYKTGWTLARFEDIKNGVIPYYILEIDLGKTVDE